MARKSVVALPFNSFRSRVKRSANCQRDVTGRDDQDAEYVQIWQTCVMRKTQKERSGAAETALPESVVTGPQEPKDHSRPKEIGGPKGAEPTRYGDWERAGRCIDF